MSFCHVTAVYKLEYHAWFILGFKVRRIHCKFLRGVQEISIN